MAIINRIKINILMFINITSLLSHLFIFFFVKKKAIKGSEFLNKSKRKIKERNGHCFLLIIIVIFWKAFNA